MIYLWVENEGWLNNYQDLAEEEDFTEIEIYTQYVTLIKNIHNNMGDGQWKKKQNRLELGLRTR